MSGVSLCDFRYSGGCISHCDGDTQESGECTEALLVSRVGPRSPWCTSISHGRREPLHEKIDPSAQCPVHSRSLVFHRCVLMPSRRSARPKAASA